MGNDPPRPTPSVLRPSPKANSAAPGLDLDLIVALSASNLSADISSALLRGDMSDSNLRALAKSDLSPHMTMRVLAAASHAQNNNGGNNRSGSRSTSAMADETAAITAMTQREGPRWDQAVGGLIRLAHDTKLISQQNMYNLLVKFQQRQVYVISEFRTLLDKLEQLSTTKHISAHEHTTLITEATVKEDIAYARRYLTRYEASVVPGRYDNVSAATSSSGTTALSTIPYVPRVEPSLARPLPVHAMPPHSAELVALLKKYGAHFIKHRRITEVELEHMLKGTWTGEDPNTLILLAMIKRARGKYQDLATIEHQFAGPQTLHDWEVRHEVGSLSASEYQMSLRKREQYLSVRSRFCANMNRFKRYLDLLTEYSAAYHLLRTRERMNATEPSSTSARTEQGSQANSFSSSGRTTNTSSSIDDDIVVLQSRLMRPGIEALARITALVASYGGMDDNSQRDFYAALGRKSPEAHAYLRDLITKTREMIADSTYVPRASEFGRSALRADVAELERFLANE